MTSSPVFLGPMSIVGGTLKQEKQKQERLVSFINKRIKVYNK